MDDQLSRCLVAEQEGWGYVVQDRTKKHIQQGIEKLLNHSTESKHQQHPNGADDLSKKLGPRLGVAD